jgi:glycosyltransferase involved in cell wall biosynthesis
MHKPVLFIAYSFPPCGGPSVQRSLKFVKYLPEYGWQPVVVTAEPGAYPIHDASLKKDVPPGTPVYRAAGWDVNAWRPAFARLHLLKLHAAINTLLALPDGAIFWARAARTTAEQAFATHRPQVMYTTSGPYSSHLLGLWAKRSLGLPWVADFRDPWSKNRVIRYPPGYRALNRRMEAQVLQAADYIVTVSQPIAHSLSELSGGRTPVTIIHNGYDPDDVAPLAPVTTDKFTITYTGNFTRLRRPDALIAAVTALVDAGRIPIGEIELLFAGGDMDRYVPTRPPFTKLGYLPHSELQAVWQRSTMLLLIQDPSPENLGDYSAKLFEYLATNRPILAITNPATVAADLVRRTHSGVVTSHALEEVEKTVYDCYCAWKAGRLTHAPDWAVIQQFSRRALTAQLAGLFDQMRNL